MKTHVLAAAALAAQTSLACAGGIERTANDYGLLFQPGDSVGFSLTLVNPSVSGKYSAALGGGGTGNMAKSYASVSATYKNQLSDKLDFALYVNEPYGANSLYTKGVYAGLNAEWDSQQTAALLRYRLNDRISVFGGTRYVKNSARIIIPELLIRGAVGAYATQLGTEAAAAAAAGDAARAAALGAEARRLGTAVNPAANPLGDPGLVYRASTEERGEFGYVAGVAYEIPDIAFRAALTWESEIEYGFRTSEALPTLGIGGNTTTKITMPQTVALDLQSGIAPGTLLFGGVKWTEWSKWHVAPPSYLGVTGREITGLDDDIVTWKLGVGRQFNENVSGFAQVTYEAPNDNPASRLNPVDGRLGLALGGQITHENVKVRGGIEYVSLGDATDRSGTKFEGNSAIGVGLSFTMSF